ncbi:MAG: NirA family protein [Akkermansiaceae bacterium]
MDTLNKLQTDSPEPFNDQQNSYLSGFLNGVQQRAIVFADLFDQYPGAQVEADEEEEEEILTAEERMKREEHPLDSYYRLVENARANKSPDKEEAFRFKWNGLFYLTPVHEHYMARLRIPGGQLNTYQLRGIAKTAQDLTTGYIQITNRCNFQVRLIAPKDTPAFLTRIQDIGLHCQGSGADNARNLTASPTAGFDPVELIDCSPYILELGRIILSTRTYYNLPRKFNISFDGGGLVSTVEDTNDIGAKAVYVTNEAGEKEVYFRIVLGGATGLLAFAEDFGVLVHPDQLVQVCCAIMRVFTKHGDRTNRKKARLKHLLEKMTLQEYLTHTEEELGYPLRKSTYTEGDFHWPNHDIPHSQVGAFAQSQPGLNYIGVNVPVGHISIKQLNKIADIADTFGNGQIRLTVWQNLIIPNIPDDQLEAAKTAIKKTGLDWEQSHIKSGFIACTGSKYCKYAATDTKGHALDLMKKLDKRITLDQPINIHFTGCPHSCAQHYMGDLGLLGAKTADGLEAYHVFVGGGFGKNRAFGRQVFTALEATSLEATVAHMLQTYMDKRGTPEETFQEFTNRYNLNELQVLFSN